MSIQPTNRESIAPDPKQELTGAYLGQVASGATAVRAALYAAQGASVLPPEQQAMIQNAAPSPAPVLSAPEAAATVPEQGEPDMASIARSTIDEALRERDDNSGPNHYDLAA